SEVIFPELALGFDGSETFDPDLDALTYQWDFGDGQGSTDITTAHAYASADQARTVTLTVSDGQMTSTASLNMRSCPQPEGVAPGTIKVAADAPLEFGGVAPGSTATRTFTVTNTATDDGSVLAACVGLEGDAFSVSPD